MKVAYYSPLPPSRSGVADYSALLLPALEQRIDVEIARPGRFRRTPKADVALYHVGNDPEAHGWIVEALRRRPGVVVLHELVLHHLVAGITLARGDAAGYLAAMERDHGLAGRLLAYGVLDNRIPPLWETRPQDFPLAGEILRLAQSLVVHSRYVEEGARAAGYEGPIARIPHPAWATRRRDGHRGQPHRLLRPPQREQADPAALRGLRAPAGAASRRAVARRRWSLATARRSRGARRA